MCVWATSFAGTWSEQVVNSTGKLDVLDAVTNEVAWAAGDGGQVFRTIDGGANWDPRPTPSGYHTAIHAFDADRCVVAGSTGAFWRTTDGGFNWTDVHQAGTFIDGIHFFDAQNGWAIGDPVASQWVIRATTDGGATWSPAPAPPTAQGGGITKSLSWIGTQIGVFGTNQFVIWRTTDGGQSWNSVTAATRQVAGLVLSPDGIGLVGGDLNLLERSTDQGETWTVIQSPTIQRLLTFDWVEGTNEVWGSTSVWGLFHSTDAGLSWEQHTLGPSYVAEDLDFVSTGTGWSVGSHGSTLNGRIWRYATSTTGIGADAGVGAASRLQVAPAPNPFTSDVVFTARNAEHGPAILRILDVTGRQVALLTHPGSSAGFELRWDGRDARGRAVPGGTYLWRLELPAEQVSGKLVRISR
jgi:photosystem II stability/assembly factor-like uncharacterized protein